jgi:hypothetical protein
VQPHTKDYEDVINSLRKGREPDDEGTSELLERLFDEMQTIAPEGHYFGAHEGDGSDFGFWPAEQDNPGTPRRSRDFSSAKVALRDRLSAARSGQYSHDQIIADYQALKQRFNLTQRAWAELYGYFSAVIDSWYHKDLIFCTVWQGNIYPNNWDTMPEPLKEEIRKGIKHPDGHFWTRDGKIGRPFSSDVVV